ncbi:hypothetical protein BH24ACI3_BH24ACI3_02450 [soil metagenome]
MIGNDSPHNMRNGLRPQIREDVRCDAEEEADRIGVVTCGFGLEVLRLCRSMCGKATLSVRLWIANAATPPHLTGGIAA